MEKEVKGMTITSKTQLDQKPLQLVRSHQDKGYKS